MRFKSSIKKNKHSYKLLILKKNEQTWLILGITFSDISLIKSLQII